MAKFDVFVTLLDTEHATVNAENEEEARAKVDRYLGKLMEAGIMDPADLINAKVEVRPVEWNRLENLE